MSEPIGSGSMLTAENVQVGDVLLQGGAVIRKEPFDETRTTLTFASGTVLILENTQVVASVNFIDRPFGGPS